ncbi:MAG TPA: dUTP diphosphatase [Pyrinomonadaceae bacterium]|nr:dUTP diphosphatase [Pyrinomonadaceae bacterium]
MAAPGQVSSSRSTLNFKCLDPRAILPTRGSAASAGLDLYSIEDITIAPRQRVLARTGLAVAVPPGFYGRVAPRSGLAVKNGLDVLAGVIDSDYRGEVCCALLNTGDEPLTLPQGSRLCQLIIEQIITPFPAWTDDLDKTDRGDGGFGSTG